MPLYWLGYRHNTQISVVIEPGSLVHARMRASMGRLGCVLINAQIAATLFYRPATSVGPKMKVDVVQKNASLI
jgi:hypothetical protein